MISRRSILVSLLAVLLLFTGGTASRLFLPELASAQTTTTPKIVSGITTATTSTSGYVTVDHGLGAIPAHVDVTVRSPLSGSTIPWFAGTNNHTATTFQARFLQLTNAKVDVYASKAITFTWSAQTASSTTTTTTTVPPTTTAPTTTTAPPTTTTNPPAAADSPNLWGIFIDTDAYKALCDSTKTPTNAYSHIMVHWHAAIDSTCGMSQWRQRFPKAKILAYQNLVMMIAGPHSPGRATTLVTQEEADAHETNHADSWYLHNTSGEHISSCGWTYLKAANFTRASYQSLAKTRIPAIAKDGFDGVVFDDANTFPGHCMNTADANHSVEFTSDVAYGEAVNDFLAKLKPDLDAAGLGSYANIAVNPWTASEFNIYAKMVAVTNPLREHWMGWGDATDLFSGTTWSDVTKLQTTAEAAGREFLANLYQVRSPLTSAQAIRYGMSSLLINWNGTARSSFGHNAGMPASDLKQYGPELGAPVEAKRAVGVAWARKFDKGQVVINPHPSTAQTIDLGGSYVDQDGVTRSSITLQPKTGAILAKPTQPAACAWPDCFPGATNTGVPEGTTLQPAGDMVVTTPGMVIDGLNIAGSVSVQADNVVIKRSKVRDFVEIRDWDGHTNLRLEDVEIGSALTPNGGGGEGALRYGNWSCVRCDIHHSSDLTRGNVNITLQDSWVHDTWMTTGAHADAYQQYQGGGTINILHNRMDVRPANSTDLGNGAIFMADFPTNGRATIKNNLLAGGNFTLWTMDGTLSSGYVYDVQDNTIEKGSYAFGPCRRTNTTDSNLVWSGNRYDDGTALALSACAN